MHLSLSHFSHGRALSRNLPDDSDYGSGTLFTLPSIPASAERQVLAYFAHLTSQKWVASIASRRSGTYRCCVIYFCETWPDGPCPARVAPTKRIQNRKRRKEEEKRERFDGCLRGSCVLREPRYEIRRSSSSIEQVASLGRVICLRRSFQVCSGREFGKSPVNQPALTRDRLARPVKKR